MKEIKIKVFIVVCIWFLGVIGIAYTYKKKQIFEEFLNFDENAQVKKELNSYLQGGCTALYSHFEFNQQKNFVSVRILNYDLIGSVYVLNSRKGIVVYELNLESSKNALKYRGYFFENRNQGTCYGMVL